MGRQGSICVSLNNGGIFSPDLTLEGSIFQRIGAPTAKALVQILVSTLGMKSNSELDDRI